MKSIIAIFLFIQTSFAQAPKHSPLVSENIILNPKKSNLGRFIVAYNDFEDIRVDSDLDGKIDYWHLKRGGLEVDIHYKKGAVDRYLAKKIVGPNVVEAEYRNQNGQMVLVRSNSRPLAIWAMESLSVGVDCPLKKTESSQQAAEISEAVLNDYLTNTVFDSSCADFFTDPMDKSRVSTALKSIYEGNDQLSSCLSDKDKIKELENVFSQKKIDIHQIQAKYDLLTKKIGTPSNPMQSLIACSVVDKSDGVKPVTSSENRKIIFTGIKGSPYDPKNLSKKSIGHEFLHMAGLDNEDSVNMVQEFCGGNRDKFLQLAKSFGVGAENVKIEQALDLSNTAKTRSYGLIVQDSANAAKTAGLDSTGNTKKDAIVQREPASTSKAETGFQAAAKDSTANIPTDLSVAQLVPTESTTLAQMVTSPPPKTDEGAAAALTRSASESSGVLRVANNLVGSLSTPSVASGSTLASTSSSDSDVASGSSSSSKKSNVAINTRSSVGDYVPKSRNTIGSDERVVESITLDGSSQVAATPVVQNGSVTNNVAPAQQTATKSAQSTNKANRAPASDVAQARSFTPAAPQTSAGSSGISAGLDNTQPTHGSNPAPQRAPASAPAKSSSSSSGPASSTAASREEVVTFVSNGDYSSVKTKLKDNSFSKQLETQKITILDLYGNSYGAKKGDVIFLDQGDRFVRQK